MSAAPFLREAKGGVFLSVKLQPRASRNQIGPVSGNEIKIFVTAPPVDSAANRALLDFLAETLDLPRSSIQLVRGQTSRHKSIVISSTDSAYILQKLQLA